MISQHLGYRPWKAGHHVQLVGSLPTAGEPGAHELYWHPLAPTTVGAALVEPVPDWSIAGADKTTSCPEEVRRLYSERIWAIAQPSSLVKRILAPKMPLREATRRSCNVWSFDMVEDRRVGVEYGESDYPFVLVRYLTFIYLALQASSSGDISAVEELRSR